jgi:hypothetical protein
MTQPPQPGQLAPPNTPAGIPPLPDVHGGNGHSNGRANGGGLGPRPGGREAPANPTTDGGFSYDTVSTARPPAPMSGAPRAGNATTQLPPPPNSATATSTVAPPFAPTGAPPAPPPGPPGGAPGGSPNPGTRARPGTRTSTAAANARSPRRARLQLRHINPWTVFKFACVLSIALFVIWLLAIAALYGILDATGVVNRINDAWTTIQGEGTKAPVKPTIVLAGAAVIGAVNMVLFIALSTIGSIIYNLCADIIGGIEVTLSEPEV